MCLADAELGFDACHAVVDIDDFAREGVELVVQPVEARIHARFQVAEASLHAVESCVGIVESRIHGSLQAVESRIDGIVLNRVHQNPYQNNEGRDADCQVELQVRHCK